MANPSGTDILGFSFANRMYLNGEKLNPNTIIHEAGHIWTEWTRNNDPKIYQKGMELIEGSPYLKKAKESKFYLSNNELSEKVFLSILRFFFLEKKEVKKIERRSK